MAQAMATGAIGTEARVTDLAVDTQHLPRPLSPGQLIGTRYRLDRIAGAGGMATVWRAHDERLQRPVAIKVISDALAASPAAITRFAREARTHAGIQHPNLVQVYDYSVAADQPYLVMEYVDGATLSECLDRRGLTAATIQTLALELLSAIACVHDHGVLHRDIKCGNVLLDGQGHARLTDFGLAHLEDSTHIARPNQVVGTLRFLAPELIQGQPASRQSDLFALGVLLRTAAKHAGPEPRLAKLTSWLTQHDPWARPADAHGALEFLGGRPRVVQHTTPRTSTAAEQRTERILKPRPHRRGPGALVPQPGYRHLRAARRRHRHRIYDRSRRRCRPAHRRHSRHRREIGQCDIGRGVRDRVHEADGDDRSAVAAAGHRRQTCGTALGFLRSRDLGAQAVRVDVHPQERAGRAGFTVHHQAAQQVERGEFAGITCRRVRERALEDSARHR